MRSVNVRIEEEVLNLLDTAAHALSEEKGVRLAAADVHRVALRELLRRLGIDVPPAMPSAHDRNTPEKERKKRPEKARK